MSKKILFQLTALALAMAMVVLGAGVALADYVVNNVQTSNETVSIANGGSATVQYKITNQNTNAGDTQNSCNPGDNSAATVSVNAPSGVTASPTSLTFTACDVFKSVQFSSSTAGSHSVSVTVTDAGGGVYDTSGATFTLVVAAASKADQTITFDQPTTPRTFGSTFDINPTASSRLAVTVGATGGCSLSSSTAPATVTMTSGTTACTLTASQAGNASYNPATSVIRTVDAQKANQPALAVTSPDSGRFSEIKEITFSGGSGTGAATYEVRDTSTACRLLQSTNLEITSGTGLCEIRVTKDSDVNYAAATSPWHSVAVSKDSASLSLSALSHSYDRSAKTATVTTRPSNLDGVTVTYDASSAAPTNAGSYAVVATLDNPNYAAEQATGTLVITPKQLTGSFTASSKTYDGNSNATVASRSLPGIIDGDSVTLEVSNAEFDDKNVGTAKQVTGDLALSGSQSGNYSLASATATTTAGIAKLDITGSFTTANKVYDGTTAAAATDRDLSGEITTDDVHLSGGTATFDNKNAGTDKIVTLTGATLSGTDAANYNLASVSTEKAEITPKELTGSFTASNKTYDGSDAATISGRSLSGAIQGDGVGLSGGTATFNDASAGTGKTVTGTGFSLDGDGAANYSLASSTLTTTADITRRAITVSADPKSKVWGTEDPPLTHTVTSGSLVTGDALTGELDRASGTTVGIYPIRRNTLSAGDNYALTYVGADLTITPAFTISGFYSPVDAMPTVNTIKGGSTVPLKFEVFAGSTEQKTTSIVNPLLTKQSTCGSGGLDSVEVTSTGGTSLRFDTTGDQFVYNWQTPKTVGACYTVTVTLADGTDRSAMFKIK